MQNISSAHRWVYLLQGIVLIVLGVAIFSMPGLAIASLILLLSIYFIIDGIIRGITGLISISRKRGWFWHTLGGIIEIAVGVLALSYPVLSTISFIYLIGFALVIRGFFDFAISGDTDLRGSSKGLMIFTGILDIIIGIYLIVNPFSGGLIYFWAIGVYAVIAGFATVIKSFTIKAKY